MNITDIRQKFENYLKNYENKTCQVCGRTQKELKQINKNYEVKDGDPNICTKCIGETKRAQQDTKDKKTNYNDNQQLSIWSKNNQYVYN